MGKENSTEIFASFRHRNCSSLSLTRVSNNMPIELKKGAPLKKGINLTKLTDERGMALEQIYIGLGWDVTGPGIDLDASVACLTTSEKLLANEWFVFYNNLTSPDGQTIVHSGDNRTGQGEGDDESLRLDLTRIPPQVVKILLIISIHDANGKNFTNVQNAFFRIVNSKTNQETHRLDLSAGQAGQTECLIFAEVVREGNGWGIKPVCYSIPSLSALIGNIQV